MLMAYLDIPDLLISIIALSALGCLFFTCMLAPLPSRFFHDITLRCIVADRYPAHSIPLYYNRRFYSQQKGQTTQQKGSIQTLCQLCLDIHQDLNTPCEKFSGFTFQAPPISFLPCLESLRFPSIGRSRLCMTKHNAYTSMC